ncbi:hypothetical protein ACFQLX_24040 [Streptomyces polyrhachis]|uniref:LigA protein n=1 Tax=Streptomyces polyrhachis TaxID=1282885 RepID=A0ABW2GNU8_9ACTN
MSDTELEQRFAAGIRRAGDEAVPAPDLATRGLRRGKQLRRRRRAGIAVAAALVVGGVGVTAGTLGDGLLGGDGGTSSPAAASKSPAGGGTLSAEAVADLVAGELRRVERLGADHEVSVLYSRGTAAPEGKSEDKALAGNPFATLVFDDGGGKAGVSVSFERQDPAYLRQSGHLSCPDKETTKYDSCKVTKLAGGATLVLYQGYTYPDNRPGPRDWSATYATKDGAMVRASALNSTEEKGAPTTRKQPPLTLDQLKELALSKAWQPILAGMARPAAQAPQEHRGVRSEEIAKTLIPLLPRGLVAVRPRQDDTKGYATVVADDGRGEVLFGINVDQWERPDSAKEKNSGAPEADPYAQADVLADGTKVLVEQGPGEKGGKGVQRWLVDVLRSDGRRVVINLHNTPAQWKDATRADMPLTMEQLRKIALDPSWQELKLT